MKPSAKYLIPRSLVEDFLDQSSYPDSNPRPDIKILVRSFKSSVDSFRFAAEYLKLRYQTGWNNQPRYYLCSNLISLRKVANEKEI